MLSLPVEEFALLVAFFRIEQEEQKRSQSGSKIRLKSKPKRRRAAVPKGE